MSKRIAMLKLKIGRLELQQVKEEERKILEAKLTGLKRGRKVVAFEQKHKKKIAIVKGVGYVGKRVGVAFGRIAKGVLKGVRESKGLKQTYENMYGPMPKEPRKRIAIIKRKKKKR